MMQARHLTAPVRVPFQATWWRVSWPLVMGLLTYAYLLSHSAEMMRDGDTYWHIVAGRWILENGVFPSVDPFSHTMRGAPWVAHEWLSEIVFASVHRWGGWTWVVALPALAFAWTVALLTRELLKWLEPIHALLFAFFAVFMAAGHALARPHLLAMPFMMIWIIGLVRAGDAHRAPNWWLLPVMSIWANLHGGFTLGLALTGAFALEALLRAWGQRAAVLEAVRAWGLFLLLALGASMLTPLGPHALWFTWQVMVEGGFALQQIGEWRSPNFQIFQPLELWLIGGLAVLLYQGIRLPAIRLAILLGLTHLSLKHARNIELLGLVAPLVIAAPLALEWKSRQQGKPQAASIDRLFLWLARPAGQAAMLLSAALFLGLPAWMSAERPVSPVQDVAPAKALQAAQAAGLRGPVFNEYDWGGWLAYNGIAPFVDGRTDVYGDAFLKAYAEALQLASSDSFDKLADQYKVEWTLLRPTTAAVALMDHSSTWRRLYSDETAVVHVRKLGATQPQP